MLHETSTPKADGKVKELGIDTAQTEIRRWDKMTKFINLSLCTWIVVCCCSTADCNERKLSLALAMGWRRRSSRKFEEKPYDTAGERPRANEEQGANQHKDNKSMKQE